MTEFRYPEDCKGNDQIADFWAVRLDQGDLTTPEETAFKAWQSSDPDNEKRLSRARQVWHSMEFAVAEAIDIPDDRASNTPTRDITMDQFDNEAVRRDLERLGALEGGGGRLPGMRSAKRRARPVWALMTILCLLGLWGYSAFQPEPDLIAASDANVVTSIHELPDGSRMWMEPGTRIDIEFTDHYRDISVLDGGIFIEVAKDANRPLRVHMNRMTATAVGTAFSASKWGGHVRVEVSEGTVDLESRTTKLARLTAGRASWQDEDGDLHFAAMDPARIAPWREGRWIVKDMPIDELFGRLSPLMGDETFVRDPMLGEITVSGSFDLTKPDSAYGALLAAYGLTDRAFPGGFRIISRK